MKKRTIKTQPATTQIILLISLVIISIAIILLLFTNKRSAQCKESRQALSMMNVELISLRNEAGKKIEIDTHIADDSNKRADGYQHICEDVINTTHILFVFPQPIEAQFHMQNVRTPLDIGFFDSTGMLIKTMVMDTNVDGGNQLYSPEQPFQYALEARVGFFNKHALSAGQARLVLSSVDGL